MIKGQVLVYAADTAELYDDAVFAAAYSTVSLNRKEKTDRFLFKKDKILSLGAELLLSRCLEEQGIVSYQVEYGDNGKPYLKNCIYSDSAKRRNGELYISLSHSEERVMCAVSDMDVGCDVEKVTDIELEAARLFFTSEEYEKIAAQETKEKQNDLFFRFWTLKESMMKATGKGLSLTPESFRVDMHANDYGYTFKEYDLNDGYKYSVCGSAEKYDKNIRFVRLIQSKNEE